MQRPCRAGPPRARHSLSVTVMGEFRGRRWRADRRRSRHRDWARDRRTNGRLHGRRRESSDRWRAGHGGRPRAGLSAGLRQEQRTCAQSPAARMSAGKRRASRSGALHSSWQQALDSRTCAAGWAERGPGRGRGESERPRGGVTAPRGHTGESGAGQGVRMGELPRVRVVPGGPADPYPIRPGLAAGLSPGAAAGRGEFPAAAQAHGPQSAAARSAGRRARVASGAAWPVDRRGLAC